MTDLAWRDLGGPGRPPFVLVHGYTGSSDDFAHVVGPLGEMRRIILVDLPGHGNSPRLEQYSLRAMTTAVEGFLESVVGEACDLLGHSMGGRVVLPVVTERPEMVRSLVMMDTWADEPDAEARSDDMERLLAMPDSDAATAWEQLPPAPPTAETELIEARWGREWIDAHSAFNNQVDPLAVIQLAREFHAGTASLLDEAGEIGCATTVLVGELDTPFVGPSRRMAARIPGAELVIFPGAYHSPQLTHPHEWAEALQRHLAR